MHRHNPPPVSVRRTGATNARSTKDPYGSLLTPPEVLCEGLQQLYQLRADAEVLGLNGRTDIVKAALPAEQRMAKSVDDF
jgi:hypothetical protein